VLFLKVRLRRDSARLGEVLRDSVMFVFVREKMCRFCLEYGASELNVSYPIGMCRLQ
jgi:hypothetical protein